MKKSAILLGLMACASLAHAAPSDQAFGQLTSRVSMAENEINDLGMEVTKVRQATIQNQVGIIDVRQDLQTVHKGLADAVQHAGSNSAEIGKLKTTVADHETRIGVLENSHFVNEQGLAGELAARDTQIAENTDGVDHNARRISALENRPTPTNGVDGKDGRDGRNGMDGAKGDKGDTGDKGDKGDKGDTGAAGVDGKTIVDQETKDKVAFNAKNIHALDERTFKTDVESFRQQAGIQQNATAIKQLEGDVAQLKQDVSSNTKAIKRVGAIGAAQANLHYNRSENGFAIAVGEYRGEAGIAGGLQFNMTQNSAVTVQAAYDGQDTSASLGMHGSW